MNLSATAKKTRQPRLRQPVEEADAEPLSEVVYQRLLQGILAGIYPADTVLSELGVAREFDVSRMPVHDALRQLAKDGLVQCQRNCRARVAGITADDIFEIFEMRKLLEGPAAELAAGRMDARHLSPLRAFANKLQTERRGKAWVAHWADFDELFHRTIAEASGNQRLAQDINRYRLLHKGFNRTATDAEVLQQALREHLSILEALEKKNGALARERMVAHISAWQEFFIRSVPASGIQSSPANSGGK